MTSKLKKKKKNPPVKENFALKNDAKSIYRNEMSFLPNSLTLSFSLSLVPPAAPHPVSFGEASANFWSFSLDLSRSSLAVGKKQEVRQDGLQDLGRVRSGLDD